MKKIILFAAIVAITTGITGCGSSDNNALSNSDIIVYEITTNGSEVTTSPASDITSAEKTAATSVTTSHNNIGAVIDTSDLSNKDIDIDLTQLNSTMVYAQVFDMINNGDNYLGKTVRAKGPFSYYQEPDGREFFAVIISDATACCSQGIEFVLDGDYTYPDDYPAIGTEITVVGKFNSYKEDFYTYIQLTDATMEADTSLSPE
jgi:hypothetical protein